MEVSSSSFPPRLPDADRARWLQMTPDQRENALKRIQAFDGWHATELRLADAVNMSGLSKSRFYRLAADWKSSPCLEALGAFRGSATSGKALDAAAVNALQSVLPEVIRLNADASVSQLVRLAVAKAKVPEAQLPRVSRLRQLVEHELRSQRARGQAGHIVFFDMCAIGIAQSNGRPFILFCCVDRGTGLILGSAVGTDPDAGSGYPLVALDVKKRLGSSLSGLRWTDRMEEVDITSGTDTDDSIALVVRLNAVLGAHVQRAAAPRRFGKYVRSAVGDQLGRFALTPARTESGLAVTNNGNMTPWTLEDAVAAVEVATTAFNEQRLAQLQPDGFSSPPADFEKLIEIVSQ